MSGFGFLFEMGCGKTLTTIAVLGAAYKKGKIKSVLIVAPTSVCAVWPKEFKDYADFEYDVAVLSGSKDKRLKTLNTLLDKDTEALKVVVINYESVWRDGIFDALSMAFFDFIVCDESQRIKSHKAKQSKALHQLGDMVPYKIILSGTPVQKDALDLWSQYRFLDKSTFGSNFYRFRDRYAVMGGFEGRQVVSYQNLDELISKEYSIAYRVTKDECLDLPEQTHEVIPVIMDGKCRKVYDKLKKESAAELENEAIITASTVLTKMLRLQQMTGGFAVDEEGSSTYIFDAKLKALEDIIDDYVVTTGKKLVVFCRFREEISLISKLIESKGIQYRSIYGDVPIDKRGALVKDFQENENVKIFLAQIDTAGLGITLTAADTCVYYSVNFNYAAYSQSLSRIHRIGQKNKCTYLHLVVENSIDETVMIALMKKENIAKSIVDDWKKYFY